MNNNIKEYTANAYIKYDGKQIPFKFNNIFNEKIKNRIVIANAMELTQYIVIEDNFMTFQTELLTKQKDYINCNTYSNNIYDAFSLFFELSTFDKNTENNQWYKNLKSEGFHKCIGSHKYKQFNNVFWRRANPLEFAEAFGNKDKTILDIIIK